MTAKPFHLIEDASQIKKMIQLKESLDQRIGCVIVGPSGAGKSDYDCDQLSVYVYILCRGAIPTYVL